MNIVWMSWKDRSHPLAGGAETVSGEIIDRLVRDGHHVKLITALYSGAKEHETAGNLEVFRAGSRYTVYREAKKIYMKQVGNWADVTIDEMNTIAFGAGYYNRSGKNILLAYQLARQVWFYQMIFPLSLIGYLAEPLMLRGLSKKYSVVATESESTRQDLLRHGFSHVKTFRVGTALEPLAKITKKKDVSTILSLGALRPMKRTLHAVKAFEHAKRSDAALKLVIAGDDSGAYADTVKAHVAASPFKSDITILGRVSSEKRRSLMESSGAILVTSIKEGWGLIVTEAATQGTPAVVYAADGLRDSVKNGVTGITVPNSDIAALGVGIVTLLKDSKKYEDIREAAWKWSKEFTFENSYKDFLKILSQS